MTVKGFAMAAASAVLFTMASAHGDSPSPGFPEGFEQTTVYKSGTDGYLFYRIPSVLVTSKGTVLAFAEARRSPWGAGADSGEINIVLKRSTDGGKTWGAQQVIWVDGKNTCGNPVSIFDETTGTIWLVASHNDGSMEESKVAESRAGRAIFVMSSDDDGVTWTTPREITKDVKKEGWTWYATGPGAGIQLKHGPHAGRLVVPANHSVKGGGDDGGSYSHVIYSDDHGKTWKLGGSAKVGSNESAVVELADGTVMLNMRNARGKSAPKDTPRERAIALSKDGGKTFGEMTHDSALIEPICQASIVRYTWPGEGGKGRILFANPANKEQRTDMTVRISYDEGKTWPVSQLIHKGWSCYSAITPLPDGSIGLLYEAGDRARYDRLDFVRMTLSWVSGGKDTLATGEKQATPSSK
jgi:sialidase-1